VLLCMTRSVILFQYTTFCAFSVSSFLPLLWSLQLNSEPPPDDLRGSSQLGRSSTSSSSSSESNPHSTLHILDSPPTPQERQGPHCHSRHCQMVCEGLRILSLAAKAAGVTKRRVTGGTIMAKRFCLLGPHWRSSTGRRGLAGWTGRTTSRVR